MEIILTIAICVVIAMVTVTAAALLFNILGLDAKNTANWVGLISIVLSIIFISIYYANGMSLLDLLKIKIVQ